MVLRSSVVDLGSTVLGKCIVLGSSVNFMLCRNLGVVNLGQESWAHAFLGFSVNFMLCRNLGVVNLGQRSWAYALSWAPESTSCSAET